MLAIIAAVVVLSVVSSVLTTTRQQRDEARKQFARRWNRILIPIDIIGLYILYQTLFGPRAS